MVYFHTGAMNVTQEEQQFNLSMIAKTLGSSVVTGANVWTEETVTINASEGTVSGTPIATSSGNIYGWVELSNGTTERVTFTGSNFTLVGQSSGDVCVRYYETNSSARKVTVNANIIPSVVRTVIEAQMFSGDPNNVNTSTLIGKVLVEIPRLQLDGTASLDLTSTGVSTTPIQGMALATPVTGCSSSGVYATITEVINNANWYDNVIALSVADSDVSIAVGGTKNLVVYAITNNGDAPFVPPVTDLSFTSSVPAKATVGLHTGLVTGVQAGNTLINVIITNKTSVEAFANVTVS